MSCKYRKISVVIPAFNEETRLQFTLPVLWSEISKYYSHFEVLIVDDGSTDRTSEVVTAFSGNHKNIRLVRYPESVSPSPALRVSPF